MPNPDVGSALIRGLPSDIFEMKLARSRGAVIAVGYRMVAVASPPLPIDQRSWDETDFLDGNPQAHHLPALVVGRYEIAVVVALMPGNTELEIEITKSGTLIYRRSVIDGKMQIRNITLRIA